MWGFVVAVVSEPCVWGGGPGVTLLPVHLCSSCPALPAPSLEGVPQWRGWGGGLLLFGGPLR